MNHQCPKPNDPSSKQRKRLATILALSLALACFAHSHSTDVHGDGVKDSAGQPSPENSSLTADAFWVLDSPYFNAYADSSIAVDEARGGAVAEDNTPRFLKHFYNPKTGKNNMLAFPLDTALKAADERWMTILEKITAGDYTDADAAEADAQLDPALEFSAVSNPEGAFHTLGRLLHLLQDMAAPAHIHDDPHLIRDDFEVWGEGNGNYLGVVTPEVLSTLDAYVPAEAVPLPDGSLAPAGTLKAFMQELAQFTYDLTSFQGELITQAVPQPSSELTRMFPGRVTYVDAGLIGFNKFVIDTVGEYRYPLDLLEANDWWPCVGDYTDTPYDGSARKIAGRFYIEHTDVVVPIVFERPLAFVDPAELPGMSLLDIYGRELYPQCIRYCAGLLSVLEPYFHPVVRIQFNGNDVTGEYLAGNIPVLQAPGDIVIDVNPALPVASLSARLDVQSLQSTVMATQLRTQIDVERFFDAVHTLMVVIGFSDGTQITQAIPIQLDSSQEPLQTEDADDTWTEEAVLDSAPLSVSLGENGRLAIVGGPPVQTTWVNSVDVVQGRTRYVSTLQAVSDPNTLGLRENGQWFFFNDTDVLLSGARFTAVLVDGDTLWIGTNQGLVRANIVVANGTPSLQPVALYNKSNQLVGTRAASACGTARLGPVGRPNRVSMAPGRTTWGAISGT